MPDRLKCPNLPLEIKKSTQTVLQRASDRLASLAQPPNPKHIFYPWADHDLAISPVDFKFGHGLLDRVARTDRFSALASETQDEGTSNHHVAGDLHSHAFRDTTDKAKLEALIKGVKAEVFRVRPIPRPGPSDLPFVACETWPRHAKYDTKGFLGPHCAIPPAKRS